MPKTSIVHKKIAEKVKKYRKQKGVSQEELAHEAGVNRAYIGYIERGERKPSVDTLEKIAKALKIRISELF